MPVLGDNRTKRVRHVPRVAIAVALVVDANQVRRD